MRNRIAALILFAGVALAQTKDSTAPRSFYSKTAATIAALSCNVGDVAFASDATPGQNLYECTATNTWTQQLNSGTPTNGSNLNILTSNGSGGFGTAIAPGTGVATALGSSVSGSGAICLASGSACGGSTPLVITNDSGGTTNANLAIILSSGKATTANVNFTSIPSWIVVSGGGTTGSATLATAGSGLQPCQTDAGGATTQHYIVRSTVTAGRCMDAGAGIPQGVYIVGQAQTTAAANANVQVSPLGFIAGVSLPMTGGGTANAQTVTYPTSLTAVPLGFQACWVPAAANTTTTPTLAINGLAAITITKMGNAALAASDINPPAIACALYDGTELQLQNPQTNTGSGGLTVGSTMVSGGTNGNVEFNNSGVLGEIGTSGTGLICRVTGSACPGGSSVPSFNVTTTSTVITMAPGSILTAANGVSVLAGTYTITHVSGTDSGTFYAGPNASNQAACWYSAGITLSNWTVVGFAGSACTPGSPPADIYTVAVSVVSGVVSSAPAQYQPVTNQVISQGTCISVANSTTVAFTTSCQQTFTSVSFSATPTFTYGNGVNTFEITLTGNVSSSTVSGAAAGQIANFIICQDGSGSRTFTWPSSFHGALTISGTASKCNAQSFAYDGSAYFALSAGVTAQ